MGRAKRMLVSVLVAAAAMAAVASPALAQANQGIGQYGPEGWTILRPSPDTRFIFVSSSEGNDANDGLSPQRPKRTIDQGRRAVRNGYPDWVLLKRGDTFNEEFRWYGNGRSLEEPMVIAAYGDGEDRPVVEPPIDKGGFAIGVASQSFLAITGIEFRAAGPNSQNGIRVIADVGEGLLIEDCLIDGFKDNIVFVAKDALGGFETFELRRCVVTDSRPAGGHSQGIYVEAVDGIKIEDCVFDHNGWAEGPNPAAPTMFNHNIYIQHNCGPSVIKGNIIASGSSHGLQARSGGEVRDNLFVRNALGLFVAINESHVVNNVVLEGRDIDANTPRGFGIEVLPIPDGRVKGNIIAHRMTNSDWGYGIQLSTGEWGPSDMKVRIEGNVVYEWPDIAFRAYRSNASVYRDVDVVDNDFQDRNGQSMLIEFAPADVDLTRWSFTGNRYWSNKPGGSAYRVGSGSGNHSWWQSKCQEWTSQSQAVTYPDPERTVATYWASLGKAGGYDAFMQAARGLSRASWDPRFTAAAVNDYIREGFGVPEVP